MFVKPKSKEKELDLLVNIIIIAGLSKVYSEKLYAMSNDTRHRIKSLFTQTMKANDLLHKEFMDLIKKQPDPFGSALIDIIEGIDDSVYDDYFEQLKGEIVNAFTKDINA